MTSFLAFLLDSQPPKDFKLRWLIKEKDGSEQMLQRPVKNRTSLSAAEVLSVIESHTRKHVGDGAGQVLKIELVERSARLAAAAAAAASAGDASAAAGNANAAPAVAAAAAAVAAAGSNKITYRGVNVNDRFRLPLVFPGPVFKDLCVLEFRVTFSEPPTSLSIPKSLRPIASLPSFIDCGEENRRQANDSLFTHLFALLRRQSVYQRADGQR